MVSLFLSVCAGGAAIKKYAVLNDKRHILTKDTDNNVAIYDVLKVTKVKDLGPVDFDNELNQHNPKIFIPNWFTVDLKTGVCYISFKSNYFSRNMKLKFNHLFLWLRNKNNMNCSHRCQQLCSVQMKWIASVRGFQPNKVYPSTLKLVLT